VRRSRSDLLSHMLCTPASVARRFAGSEANKRLDNLKEFKNAYRIALKEANGPAHRSGSDAHAVVPPAHHADSCAPCSSSIFCTRADRVLVPRGVSNARCSQVHVDGTRLLRPARSVHEPMRRAGRHGHHERALRVRCRDDEGLLSALDAPVAACRAVVTVARVCAGTMQRTVCSKTPLRRCAHQSNSTPPTPTARA
jgi:hypothetical protein